jgi:hypothetical protein
MKNTYATLLLIVSQYRMLLVNGGRKVYLHDRALFTAVFMNMLHGTVFGHHRKFITTFGISHDKLREYSERLCCLIICNEFQNYIPQTDTPFSKRVIPVRLSEELLHRKRTLIDIRKLRDTSMSVIIQLGRILQYCAMRELNVCPRDLRHLNIDVLRRKLEEHAELLRSLH